MAIRFDCSCDIVGSHGLKAHSHFHFHFDFDKCKHFGSDPSSNIVLGPDHAVLRLLSVAGAGGRALFCPALLMWQAALPSKTCQCSECMGDVAARSELGGGLQVVQLTPAQDSDVLTVFTVGPATSVTLISATDSPPEPQDDAQAELSAATQVMPEFGETVQHMIF